MKRLSKQDRDDMAKALADIEARVNTLDFFIRRYNDAVAEARSDVETNLELLNQAITDADELRATLADNMDNYYDDRSDKWREGDAGQAYYDWKEQWSHPFEQVELDIPYELEMPEVEAIELIGSLENEPFQ